MRYINGESPTLLGKEMMEKGLVTIGPNTKPADAIMRYAKMYRIGGIEALKARTGKFSKS